MPGLAIARVPHPVNGNPDGVILEKAEEVVAAVAEGFLRTERAEVAQSLSSASARPEDGRLQIAAETSAEGGADVLLVEPSWEAVNELFLQRRWADGLPIVPPTERRVARTLRGTWREPSDVIALIPPQMAEATVEKIAVNAVMAGCLPEHLPLLITAIQAATRPEFNLSGVQTTTYSAAPLMLVNGPIMRELGINGGAGAFGPGTRANAVIGRALRLVLMNVGGATPGDVSRDTHAHPGKYTYCVGENEEANPWEPLNVELGFALNESTVTLFAADAPHNVSDHANRTAKGILTVIAHALTNIGLNQLYFSSSPVLLGLCPEHARTIAGDGWAKQDVKRFLFERARVPLRLARVGAMYWQRHWPRWFDTSHDDAMIPMVSDPENIYVVVVGGEGKHSALIPTVGISEATTARLDRPVS